MTEKTAIARPYARAIFGIAHDTRRITEWSDLLGRGAAMACDPRVCQWLRDPRIARPRMVALFLDLADDNSDDWHNLLRLLVASRRLVLLPEIAQQYESLRAEAERTLEAEVVSAVPLDELLRARLAEALGRRLRQRVILRCTVDHSVLGGAIVRAGDLVIDGSVRGRLAALAAYLNH